MPSLVIPESGMLLEGSSSKPGQPAPGVIGLTLTNNMIEEMIKCVQNGKPIELSLGKSPNISFGNKTQNLSTFEDPFTHELYRSTISPTVNSSSNSTEMAPTHPKGNAVRYSVFGRNSLYMQNKKKEATAKAAAKAPQTADDAGVEALRNSMREETVKKKENTTKFLANSLPPPGRRGATASKVTNKSKFLAQNRALNETTRSMPTSPALTGVGSPSLGPTSVPLSQQQAEQAKAERAPVIHVLAQASETEKFLREEFPALSRSELNSILTKCADLNQATGRWELANKYFKELDVWNYDYKTDEDRQKAITNAAKKYDRMRLSHSEPEWDRLLPKSERGTGKTLSTLQAQIAQGPVARPPKINVQKAGSGRDTPTGDDEDLFGDKNLSKVKGESMARSVSQPPTAKAKKASEKERLSKTLLAKNASKVTKTASKAAATKKEKAKPNGKAPLSSQFVSESDEDEDNYMIPAKPARATAKAKEAPVKTKRAREEEETSDSSVPLSKKAKKETKTQTPTHRISDASQSSRTTNTSTSTGSTKMKSNSPQKSSPLASSLTNASDFDNSSIGRTSSSASPAHTRTKHTRSPIHKRHQKSSSVSSSSSSTNTSSSSSRPLRYIRGDMLDIARKYRLYYPEYVKLHNELSAILPRRDQVKETQLLEMHDRLITMKQTLVDNQEYVTADTPGAFGF